MTPVKLVGREPELTRLHHALDHVSERGSAILVTGEPGIGKSSLLAAAASHARERSFRVLTVTGVDSETRLPFAGLHQLLRPLLVRPDELPAAQRDVILSALGLNDLPPLPPFRTALAVLDLLSEAAAAWPVLIVAEDAHALDRPTWDVLAFIGRRMEADRIVLLASCRDGPSEQDTIAAASGFTLLPVRSLDEEAAGAILDERAPGLSPTVRARILQEAAGNPLAVVELPNNADQFLSDAALPTWLPLSTRLEQAFATRMGSLPPTARCLLLVAALDDGDTIDEIMTAASRMIGAGLRLEHLSPAIDARLITIGGAAIRFWHPLVRSAIAQGASLAQRRAAHAALAEQLQGEPDRQIWHRAAASTGPDEELAAALDAAADRAVRRGAADIAEAALETAARLSADPQARGARLLSAVEAAFQLGRHETFVRLLQTAESLTLDDAQQTRLAWFRETLLSTSWSGASQIAGFVEIANRMRRQGETDRALNALLLVAMRCWWSNPDPETRAIVRAAAEAIDVAPDDPRLIEILALAAPIEVGASIIDRLDQLSPVARLPEQLLLLGTAGHAVGAFDLAAPFLSSAAAGLRAQGRLGLLAQALVSVAAGTLNLGRLDLGRTTVEEAERLATETGQPLWAATAQAIGAGLAARRGDCDFAEAQASRAESTLLWVGAHPLLGLVEFARGMSALATGRYGESVDHLRRVFDPCDVAHHENLRAWVVADLAEAAVHAAAADQIRPLIARLGPLVDTTASPVLRLNYLYAMAVLTDPDEAEPHFEAALAVDQANWPFQRARLQFAYGVWLRRQRRTTESRTPLRTAVDTFDAIGATPWLDRARQELRATGETLRRQDDRLVDQLTPQELQIAQLAAHGLTNREIGDQLYLSHRTVGTHLYRLYPKLNVTSRAQLRDALTELSMQGGG